MRIGDRLARLENGLLARLARFGITGGLASAIYALVTLVCVDRFEASGTVASIIGYLVAIPVSFLGQKLWTFKSKGSVSRELPRFLTVQGANLVLAAAVMAVVKDILGFDRMVGIVAVVLIIPTLTYLVLSRRVFTARGGP